MKAYIDRYRDAYGVEPICKVLQIAPSCYRRHAARLRNPALRCKRAQRDDALIPDIKRVWHANWQVYGADKVWKQMNREGMVMFSGQLLRAVTASTYCCHISASTSERAVFASSFSGPRSAAIVASI